jgi:hypothetical protein
MTTRPDSLQSSKRFQRSSAYVRTTWLYRLHAIQSLSRNWISCSDTDREIATVRTEGQHRPDTFQVSRKIYVDVSVFLSQLSVQVSD